MAVNLDLASWPWVRASIEEDRASRTILTASTYTAQRLRILSIGRGNIRSHEVHLNDQSTMEVRRELDNTVHGMYMLTHSLRRYL